MLDDAAAIIHNQWVLAGIYDEIDKRILSPHEQDFIYSDFYGHPPVQPKRIIIDGVEITTRLLHQEGIGLRDIAGADLLYEIEGEKFTLIQYKKVHNGQVKNDVVQMKALIDNCPDACYLKNMRPVTNLLPLKINGFCGVWYEIVLENGERNVVHACEAEAIFGSQKSIKAENFNRCLSQEAFTELFAKCRIGAMVRKYPEQTGTLPKYYIEPALKFNHVVLEIRQSGQWQRKLIKS